MFEKLNDTCMFIEYDQNRWDCLQDHLNVDDYSLPSSIENRDIANLIVNNEQYSFTCEWDSEISISTYLDETFPAFIGKILDSNDNSVISLCIDSRLVDKEAPVSECLYQTLVEILCNENPSFEYISQYVFYLWDFKEIFALNLFSLSENYISENEKFEWMYNQIKPTVPDNWDLVMVHYNNESDLFSFRGLDYSLVEFIQQILEDGTWTAPNSIWLWACDAGIPNKNGIIVAQEMSAIIKGTVKAANGRIIVAKTKYHVESNPDYIYFIVDVNDTKWDNIDYSNMSWLDYNLFRLFLLFHARDEETEWNVYREGEYIGTV